MDYFKKLESTNAFDDLAWNIPEQATGVVNILGGHSGSFFAPVKSAEYLKSSGLPLKTVNLNLPAALEKQLGSGPVYLPSTSSGSFTSSEELDAALSSADFSILIGDLSKNSATTIALAHAIKESEKPVLLTRDSIDLLLPEMPALIEREDLYLVGSLAQLQKLLRAVYYPKMLLLSMPLLSVVEVLHKFTLSYPATILTFHSDQILVAYKGQVLSLPLEKTAYSGQPIKLWAGDLACRIAALNLFSPGKKLEATTLAVTDKL